MKILKVNFFSENNEIFQGGTSVVVPYYYLFLLSVFILWFSYYVSGIFCKFEVAEWPPIWERAVHSVFRKCLS